MHPQKLSVIINFVTRNSPDCEYDTAQMDIDRCIMGCCCDATQDGEQGWWYWLAASMADTGGGVIMVTEVLIRCQSVAVARWGVGILF